MALEAPTSAQQKEIPWFVKEAARLVPPKDYVRLRLNADEVSADECGKIMKVVELIRKQQMNAHEEKVLNESDDLEPTKDPLLIIARRSLKKVPLRTYLLARYTVIGRALERNARNFEEFKSIIGEEEQAGKIEVKGRGLADDRQFIAQAAWEARISLT